MVALGTVKGSLDGRQRKMAVLPKPLTQTGIAFRNPHKVTLGLPATTETLALPTWVCSKKLTLAYPERSPNDNKSKNRRDCQYPNNPRGWPARGNIPYRDYFVLEGLSTGGQPLAVWRNLEVINPRPLLNERELLAAIDRVQQLDLVPRL
jgi:hypothetical protein